MKIQKTIFVIATTFATICLGSTAFAQALNSAPGGKINVEIENSLTIEEANAVGGDNSIGGTVSLKAGVLHLREIHADSGEQGPDGAGGKINLEATSPIDLSQAKISATGAKDAYGGELTVSKLAPTKDFDNIVFLAPRFDPAEPAGFRETGATVKFLSSDVTCEYVRYQYDNWPKFYWNCATQSYLQSKIPLETALSLTGFESYLANTKIWVWNSALDYAESFSDSDPELTSSTLGLTYPNNVPTDRREYVNIFQTWGEVPEGLWDYEIQLLTYHELAHAFDLNYFHTNRPDYSSTLQVDYQTLDYDLVGPTGSTSDSHRRHPCEISPNDNQPGPFRGLSAVCDGDNVNWVYLFSANSDILKDMSIGGYAVKSLQEQFAETFAFVRKGNIFAIGSPEIQFWSYHAAQKNGYFLCARSWAISMETPLSPSTCSGAKQWYIDQNRVPQYEQ